MLGRGSLLAYLVHMTLRIVEIHRVLKPTGSFYLHCDPTASHYLKLVLDAVFVADDRGGEFINEVIWSYRSGGGSKKHFGRKHDVLFWYAKSKRDWTFNADEVRVPYSAIIAKKREHLFNADGKVSGDVWDIARPPNHSKELLGYPTQKPEALLERIIKASSNEGDTVLDAYCGCGTTVAVAQQLGRRWIGIDITYQSIALILKRFEDSLRERHGAWQAFLDDLLLDGVPRDLESAMALANRKDDKTRKEFEKWAVLTYSRNQARINEKKGADGGIDGIAYFLKDRNENGKAIFQVKSRAGTRADLATLNSDRLREKAEFGFLICTALPTKPMRDEIAAAGRYRHPLLDREDDRLQVVTVAELFDRPGMPGKRLDLPMARADAVKSAAAIGDGGSQAALDILKFISREDAKAQSSFRLRRSKICDCWRYA